MEFFRTQTNFRFMSVARPLMMASLLLALAAIALVTFRGMNFGLDFTGGTLVEFEFAEAPDLTEVRGRLANGGFGDAVVQNLGSVREVMVRVPGKADVGSAELSERIKTLLPEAAVRRVETVGPQVGAELAEQALLALTLSLVGVWIYVLFRFEWRLATAAIVATLHDVVWTAGLVSLLGLPFDVTSVAGLLTVVGYSVNDTIVVFDRMRETFRKQRRMSPPEVVDLSLNATLSRTIMTAGTTLLTVVALLVFGGEALYTFAFIMAIGIVVGTFSSIFIAAPVALLLGVQKVHLMPVAKEGASAEGRP